MKRLPVFLRVSFCQVALLVGGQALADGAAPLSSRAMDRDQVIGQVTFHCKGGVRVQVTKMPDRARVEFAGRSLILHQTSGTSSVPYRNAEFAWVNTGKVAYMKNTRSGQLAVSGCMQVK